MSNLDGVIAEIAQITEAAKSGTLVDRDALVASMEQQINDLVAAQVKQRLDSAPQRRVEGIRIGEDGDGSISKANRYHAMAKGLRDDGYYNDWGQRYTATDVLLAHLLISRASSRPGSRVEPPSEDLKQVVKFLTPGGVGSGAEYIPRELDSTVWRDFFLASRIAANTTPVTMPTDPFDIPRGFGAPTWRRGTPGTPIATPGMATGDDTLTATEILAQQNWAYEMTEDTALALMPLMREELVRSGSEVMDSFILNADATAAATGNINSSNLTPAADAFYLSRGQDGLRHQHLVDAPGQTSNMGGALTDAGLTTMLGLMGRYATDVQNLVLTCDVQTYLQGFLNSAVGAPGSFVMTLERFGPQALVYTGQLAAYRGIPIIPSQVYPRTLATGLVDAVTAGNNTFGNITVYHRQFWRHGFRRQLLIEVDQDITTRSYIMVVSFRMAVAARGPRGAVQHTAGMRNIT